MIPPPPPPRGLLLLADLLASRSSCRCAQHYCRLARKPRRIRVDSTILTPHTKTLCTQTRYVQNVLTPLFTAPPQKTCRTLAPKTHSLSPLPPLSPPHRPLLSIPWAPTCLAGLASVCLPSGESEAIGDLPRLQRSRVVEGPRWGRGGPRGHPCHGGAQVPKAGRGGVLAGVSSERGTVPVVLGFLGSVLGFLDSWSLVLRVCGRAGLGASECCCILVV